jgi:hypothetical protein
MGFFARIMGLEDSHEDWQRDQVERGGTRASSTLQRENRGDTRDRLDAIKEREPETWKTIDRRSGEDRRGWW